jgi:hypothetical protein
MPSVTILELCCSKGSSALQLGFNKNQATSGLITAATPMAMSNSSSRNQPYSESKPITTRIAV